jgi:hypothetical protein
LGRILIALFSDEHIQGCNQIRPQRLDDRRTPERGFVEIRLFDCFISARPIASIYCPPPVSVGAICP